MLQHDHSLLAGLPEINQLELNSLKQTLTTSLLEGTAGCGSLTWPRPVLARANNFTRLSHTNVQNPAPNMAHTVFVLKSSPMFTWLVLCVQSKQCLRTPGWHAVCSGKTAASPICPILRRLDGIRRSRGSEVRLSLQASVTLNPPRMSTCTAHHPRQCCCHDAYSVESASTFGIAPEGAMAMALMLS
jgi:hypothetical protein